MAENVGNDRIFLAISESKSERDLKQWMKNARAHRAIEVERAAFTRLVMISAEGEIGSLENDFWQVIHAFELALSDERGRTTRLGRTRQKVARVGVVKTLEDWSVGKRTDGFEMLIERGMAHLTGEAVVLRHPDRFPEAVVRAARQRLETAETESARSGPAGS